MKPMEFKSLCENCPLICRGKECFQYTERKLAELKARIEEKKELIKLEKEHYKHYSEYSFSDGLQKALEILEKGGECER